MLFGHAQDDATGKGETGLVVLGEMSEVSEVSEEGYSAGAMRFDRIHS
jgi:hypothetical protein